MSAEEHPTTAHQAQATIGWEETKRDVCGNETRPRELTEGKDKTAGSVYPGWIDAITQHKFSHYYTRAKLATIAAFFLFLLAPFDPKR